VAVVVPVLVAVTPVGAAGALVTELLDDEGALVLPEALAVTLKV
jgi:hypothetical protein